MSAETKVSPAEWRVLSPINDPVGFGGMAAGVLNGRLVAVGGTQWTAPMWKGGKRLFSDRVFVLDRPEGNWHTSTGFRLPKQSGHFAAASEEGRIVIAGGFADEGALSSAYVITAKKDEFAISPLPDLPTPIVYGTAILSQGRFYVFGGLRAPADKVASAAVWSIELGAATAWRREPDLPGSGKFLMTAAPVGEDVYLFGGMAFDESGKPLPANGAYRLRGGAWETLAPMSQARVAAVSPAAVLPTGEILIAGGYAEVFGGTLREHPGFASETLIYNPAAGTWRTGPRLPTTAHGDRDLPGDAGPLPMIGAPGVQWRNWYVVINGEVRVATRTPAVIALRLSK